MNILESEVAPGPCGVMLFDDTPELTQAHVRPFIWAILLYRGAVRLSEVVHCLTAVCSLDELRTGFLEQLGEDYDDLTRAEYLTLEVLGEMVSSGLCRYNQEEDLWVLDLGTNQKHLSKIINVLTAIDGVMPKHLLFDLAATEHRMRLKNGEV